MGLISLLIFLPLAGAVLIALGPREKPGLLRGIALTTSVVTFLLSLGLFTRFVAGEGGFQLVETRPWVPGLGIAYRVGIDGISLFLVLLEHAAVSGGNGCELERHKGAGQGIHDLPALS